MAQSLKDQINKAEPFSSAHEEAMLNIYRTAAHLAGAEQSLLKEYRLSSASYNLLRILRGHHLQGETEGVRASSIGCEMVVRTPDVTRLVDRLEEMKLVSRRVSADDKRVKFVKVTKKGLDLLEKIDPKISAHINDRLGHMSQRDMQALSRLLERVRNESNRSKSKCTKDSQGKKQ